MVDESDNTKLRAALAALTTERDAAVSALERHQLEADEGSHLLVEEQDRFVSRLLESHERELGRLRLELEEATTTALRLEQKHERDRVMTDRLEEDLARALAELDRMKEHRDLARVETRRAQQAYVGAQAAIEKLQNELSMARAMLGDAMDGERKFQSVDPKPTAHEPSRAPRDSGIVNRRAPPRARSTPPGVPRPRDATRRSETPRGIAANAGTKESAPPSSR
jgi:chromosome segregation ATPase